MCFDVLVGGYGGGYGCLDIRCVKQCKVRAYYEGV